MKKELIYELFQKFEQACYIHQDVECWSARELQDILGYSKWDNFLHVIEKAKEACKASGEKGSDHFADIEKMINLAKGAKRQIEDIALTRYACYLIAQNGDSSKDEIAFAQAYIASQAQKYVYTKQKIDELYLSSEKRLFTSIYKRGVTKKAFAIINSKGNEALFGGLNTNQMKQKLKIPDHKPLADFLPTLTIKAKDFATELTSHNVVEKDLKGQSSISKEHIDNNLAVRKILVKRGVKLEELPSAEDVTKVKQRLNKEKKKALTTTKKIRKR